jgi:hypothetical protein
MASRPTDNHSVFRHGLAGLVIGAIAGAVFALIVSAIPLTQNHDGGSSAVAWFAGAAFGGCIGWFAGILMGRGKRG